MVTFSFCWFSWFGSNKRRCINAALCFVQASFSNFSILHPVASAACKKFTVVVLVPILSQCCGVSKQTNSPLFCHISWEEGLFLNVFSLSLALSLCFRCGRWAIARPGEVRTRRESHRGEKKHTTWDCRGGPLCRWGLTAECFHLRGWRLRFVRDCHSLAQDNLQHSASLATNGEYLTKSACLKCIQ